MLPGFVGRWGWGGLGSRGLLKQAREREVGEAGEADRRRGLHHLLQQQQQDLAAASMRLHAGRAVEWLYARPSVVAVCMRACVCVSARITSQGLGEGHLRVCDTYLSS